VYASESDSAGVGDAVRAKGGTVILPGPKPVRYWVDDDLNQLRAAILDLWSRL
jgi:hypothetical protein